MQYQEINWVLKINDSIGKKFILELVVEKGLYESESTSIDGIL